MRVELEGVCRPGLPQGECIITDTTDGLRVDHADARILISAELLQLLAEDHHPDVSFDPEPAPMGAVGGLLKIHGINQRVVYRLTSYEAPINAYVGEWPD